MHDRLPAADARAAGRVVRAITPPGDHGSIRLRAALGVTVTGPVRGCNGPGRDTVTLELNF